MSARRFDAVVLDVGGVLVVPSGAVMRRALGDRAPAVDDGAFERAHYEGMRGHDRSTDAEGTWRAYARAYAASLGLGERDAAVVEDVLARPALGVWSTVRDEALDALTAVAATGLPVAIVSNSDGTVEQLLADAALCQVGEGPGTPVMVIVDSHVVAVAKPDPSIFRFALDVLQVPPERAVHVGDSVRSDVAGARAAGIWPVHLDPYGLCDGADHDHVRALAGVVGLL